jgi:MFS family permease
MLADRIGLKKILASGLIVFGMVYFLMSGADSLVEFALVFTLYGIYAASTEGIAKALISNQVPKTETATAIGTFSALQSICALLASAFAGWIWYSFGSEYVFIYSAIVSTGVGGWLYLFRKGL